MKTYTVDKNVPIPPKAAGQWSVLAMRLTEAGDSVIVETDAARKGLQRAMSKAGIDSTSRSVDGVGFRIWRTK